MYILLILLKLSFFYNIIVEDFFYICDIIITIILNVKKIFLNLFIKNHIIIILKFIYI